MPSRIQRMMLVLLRYPDLTIRYVPGTSLKIPDTLSRAPLATTDDGLGDLSRDMDCQVHAVESHVAATNEVMDLFKECSANDEVLTKVRTCIVTGWPLWKKADKKSELYHYYLLRDEISAHNDLVYKGERMIVPSKMRNRVLQGIHSGHLGITKCLFRARLHFYWQGIANDVENWVKQCVTCLELRNEQPNLQIAEEAPWQTIGADVFHIGNRHYLIMTDYYSSYPEVVFLKAGSQHGKSSDVIKAMKQVFSTHGIPHLVISDGGPQFKSREFRSFSKDWCFQHELSSPGFPRGNARAERSVQTVKRLIKKAVNSRQDVEEALLAYRSTPLDSHTKSPAELMMNRSLRSKLNAHLPKKTSGGQRASYDPKYANQHTRTLPELAVGDTVRIRAQNKWSTKAKVVQKHHTPRSYVVETEKGQVYRRNRQHLMRTTEQWGFTPHHYDDDIPGGSDTSSTAQSESSVTPDIEHDFIDFSSDSSTQQDSDQDNVDSEDPSSVDPVSEEQNSVDPSSSAEVGHGDDSDDSIEISTTETFVHDGQDGNDDQTLAEVDELLTWIRNAHDEADYRRFSTRCNFGKRPDRFGSE